MKEKVDIEKLRETIKKKYPHESFYARNFGPFTYKELTEKDAGDIQNDIK